ncbi:MAG: hypothetical protein PHG15_03825 [Acinetobacter sp.]|uniref:hypothetical protein n=1 Tax=Acinetobacter sp. TaxID=472 RepID=UPI00263911BD|nr:hypothetical protein [Acinetobacter sp.]MDD2944941.1 hypothetical protein [Acinetobacter sp.]
MSPYIKIASLFILSANIALILPAIAKSDKESESTVSIHKVDFPSKVNPSKVNPSKVNPSKVNPSKVNPSKVNPSKVNPDNQMDLDENQIYFASEKYKTVKDANERLRRIRNNKSMVTLTIEH